MYVTCKLCGMEAIRKLSIPYTIQIYKLNATKLPDQKKEQTQKERKTRKKQNANRRRSTHPQEVRKRVEHTQRRFRHPRGVQEGSQSSFPLGFSLCGFLCGFFACFFSCVSCFFFRIRREIQYMSREAQMPDE